jgi:predicted negative regulator of RcsB-dependent stress response
MVETKQTAPLRTDNEVVVDRARDFWARSGKTVTIAALAVIVLGAAYLGYKYLVAGPREQKASDALVVAEGYFRADSVGVALNGDGMNPGLLKVISQYGGTKAGNLARFYAGSLLLKQGKPAEAAKHLSEFETDAKMVQARAYKLLGDAYAEQGKNSDALSQYKKAARHYEEDEVNASDYLFMAAYFADRVMKNSKEAVELYAELKSKYPRTERGFEAEKYLAQLGQYK